MLRDSNMSSSTPRRKKWHILLLWLDNAASCTLLAHCQTSVHQDLASPVSSGAWGCYTLQCAGLPSPLCNCMRTCQPASAACWGSPGWQLQVALSVFYHQHAFWGHAVPSSRPLTKMLNSARSSAVPWGTPAATDLQTDIIPLITASRACSSASLQSTSLTAYLVHASPASLWES